MSPYRFTGNHYSTTRDPKTQDNGKKPNVNPTPPPEHFLREDPLPPTTSIANLIQISRDTTALQAYLTTYLSTLPPIKPLHCRFDYLQDPSVCDKMGFPLWLTLDLNRIACSLGMGFFSFGSGSTLQWGHIFFHRFVWTEEQREQYQAMSGGEHEALAKKWALDQSFMKGLETFGISLLYRGVDERERPNPLGVGGGKIHVCKKSRAVLWMQAWREDRRFMWPGVMLRLAIECDEGLGAEDGRGSGLWDGARGEQAYESFVVRGDERAQVATLERLEGEGRCAHLGEVVKLLHFWC